MIGLHGSAEKNFIGYVKTVRYIVFMCVDLWGNSTGQINDIEIMKE